MKEIEGVDARTAQFVPTEEWMDAFQTQTTAELVANAEDFATMRARGVAKVGGIADEFYVRELVLDALEDTVTGVVAWDPDKHRLENHVIDVIRFRTRHHRKRAQRFRRQSIDDASVGAMAEIEATMASNAATPEDQAEALATETLSQLREVANRDHDVLRLLDAFSAEATKKVDVMRVSGMSSKRYEAARKRMHRLVKQLSPELRGAVARLRA